MLNCRTKFGALFRAILLVAAYFRRESVGVRSAGRKVTGVPIPSSQNVTTTYPIAVVADSRQQSAAKAFVDFVRFTPSAQGILRAWGFAKP